jgi:hypothetical protein
VRKLTEVNQEYHFIEVKKRHYAYGFKILYTFLNWLLVLLIFYLAEHCFRKNYSFEDAVEENLLINCPGQYVPSTDFKTIYIGTPFV